jgi:hypothetical protein
MAPRLWSGRKQRALGCNERLQELNTVTGSSLIAIAAVQPLLPAHNLLHDCKYVRPMALLAETRMPHSLTTQSS